VTHRSARGHLCYIFATNNEQDSEDQQRKPLIEFSHSIASHFAASANQYLP
jgi:hypothetical protein